MNIIITIDKRFCFYIMTATIYSKTYLAAVSEQKYNENPTGARERLMESIWGSVAGDPTANDKFLVLYPTSDKFLEGYRNSIKMI